MVDAMKDGELVAADDGWLAQQIAVEATSREAQIVDQYRNAVQAFIDSHASERQYDSGATLASYVNSTIPEWAAEAQTFVIWRDQVWAYALGELDKVKTGQREQPSVEELLAELPSFIWPDATG